MSGMATVALDARELTLVISDKPDIERDAVADAWAAAGGEVLRLGRFWDPPPLDPKQVRVYGADTFCQVLAQKLGLALLAPDDDSLAHLSSSLTKRAVRKTTLDTVDSASFPAFVKSVIPKLIRSRVYESASEVIAEAHGMEPGAELLTSEIVELVVEARSWVLDGVVLSIACYEGNGDLNAASTFAAEVARDAAIPSACVIDVGLTRDRGWVVIEANPVWGAGLNGCDPAAAARCIARATSPAP
jgi:hypothetical protein